MAADEMWSRGDVGPYGPRRFTHWAITSALPADSPIQEHVEALEARVLSIVDAVVLLEGELDPRLEVVPTFSPADQGSHRITISTHLTAALARMGAFLDIDAYLEGADDSSRVRSAGSQFTSSSLMPRVSVLSGDERVVAGASEGEPPGLDEQFGSLGHHLGVHPGASPEEGANSPVTLIVQQTLTFDVDNPSGLWIPAEWVSWVARSRGSVEVLVEIV